MLKFLTGFKYAFQGIFYTLKTQRNFQFHSLVMLVVIAAGFFFQISKTEWFAVILCIALVLMAELINTAIESVTDLISPNIHPLAKIAKDCAAAAVLVVSLSSALIGVIIFLPYFISF